MRRYYERNKPKFLQSATRWQKANPDKVRTSAKRYRQAHPEALYDYQKQRIQDVVKQLGSICSRCCFPNPAALQIHHINQKKDRKRDWMRKDYPLSRLELLCANCHAIEHYGQNTLKQS